MDILFYAIFACINVQTIHMLFCVHLPLSFLIDEYYFILGKMNDIGILCM